LWCGGTDPPFDADALSGVNFSSGASCGVDHLAVFENTAVKASAAPPGIFDPCEVAIVAAAVVVATASGPYPV